MPHSSVSSLRHLRPAASSSVCLARILRAQGVRGTVWLESFTDPPLGLQSYAPLRTQGGRCLDLAELQAGRGARVRARFVGVEGRAAAELLAGEWLFAARRALPPQAANVWYHADLLGLSAEDRQGKRLGEIVGVHDFGAGPLLEIRPVKGKSFFLPFAQEHVPHIDLDRARLVIVAWEDFAS